MKEIYEIRDKVSNGEMDINEAFWQVLDLLAVMPSLPDDIVRSKEQNERMIEWFKQRTGLEDALLNEHMKKIDEMLKGNGA